jgi:hypothetical protein
LIFACFVALAVLIGVSATGVDVFSASTQLAQP